MSSKNSKIKKKVTTSSLPGVSRGKKEKIIKESAPAIDLDQVIEERSKGTYRQSRHLALQWLGVNHNPTLEEIKNIDVNADEITPIGVYLTPAEYKLVECFSKLLHFNSQNQDPNQLDFYAGQSGSNDVDYITNEYGKPVERIVPSITFTIYELTKEFIGGGYVSGTHQKNVSKLLDELAKKEFLLNYIEVHHRAKGETQKYHVKGKRKLVDIDELTPIHESDGSVVIGKAKLIRVYLNPVFNAQIGSFFISKPADMIKRLEEAHGGPKIPEATKLLVDYLLNEISHKRYTPWIGETKALEKFTYPYIAKKKKGEAKKRLLDAIESAKKFGILDSYKVEKSKTMDEVKYIFKLNKE